METNGQHLAETYLVMLSKHEPGRFSLSRGVSPCSAVSRCVARSTDV
jgi:hypothetical protein